MCHVKNIFRIQWHALVSGMLRSCETPADPKCVAYRENMTFDVHVSLAAPEHTLRARCRKHCTCVIRMRIPIKIIMAVIKSPHPHLFNFPEDVVYGSIFGYSRIGVEICHIFIDS